MILNDSTKEELREFALGSFWCFPQFPAEIL